MQQHPQEVKLLVLEYPPDLTSHTRCDYRTTPPIPVAFLCAYLSMLEKILIDLYVYLNLL
jgi:hypothetical protein